MPDDSCDVVIVDDDVSLLRAFGRQLELMGHRVETFSDPVVALSFLEAGGGKCALVDLSMPQLSGLELQERLVARQKPLTFVFISAQATVPNAATAMRRGAIHFLEKPVEFDDLKTTIGEALDSYEEQAAAAFVFQEVGRRFGLLTPKQEEVFWLVTSGASNKEAARQLDITERTVKAHRSEIRRKLQARSLAELAGIRYYLENTGSK